ncbi:hypothetical protein [Cupriavidus campinensis]|uniref:hypothetical protein n=1 Tax=Cupriavidus campinensis TaxID=151783 RepID=UPI001BA6E970|nr:hypothetical protein [Cupriavidus campinensis]
MDATTQAFVTAVVARTIVENWVYWMLMFSVSFLAVFLGGYVRKRAENLATRDDFEELKRQVRETTKLTEEVKREIGHAEWKLREVNAIKREKLEELVRHLATLDTSLRRYVKKVAAGKDADVDSEGLDILKAMVSLYFPEMEEAMIDYAESCRDMILWAMTRRDQVRATEREGGDAGRLALVHQATVDGSIQHLKENFRLKGELERTAWTLMQTLLAMPARAPDSAH